MNQNDEKIAGVIVRLSRGELSESDYWTICRPLIEAEIARRGLPAKLYAPSSSGTNWTDSDFDELTAGWVCAIRGARAGRLLQDKENPSHIANAARLSIYRFSLGQAKACFSTDLWKSLNAVLHEFPSLTLHESKHDPQSPSEMFPWQAGERSARRRAVSADEVRDALSIIAKLYPRGWNKETLYNYLLQWSGFDTQGELSLNSQGNECHDVSGSLPDKLSGPADARIIGEEVAEQLLSSLSEAEKEILRVFIVPNGLGRTTLSEAADRLGTNSSTLHDRATRLKTKLNTLHFDGASELDPVAQEAFLSTLLGETPGSSTSEAGIK